MKFLTMLGATALAFVLSQQAASPAADAKAPAALTGRVSSDAEGAMDGVVVTARQDGSIVSVSVTTDAQGRYAFPENRLPPGVYAIAVRAVGYELAAPASSQIAAEQTTTLDLHLVKTKALASQLTNAEWMMSIPGTEEQKSFLLNCVGCHTLERVMRSTHNADEWMQVISRMMGYGPVSQPIKPQVMLDKARAGTPEQYRKPAEYLASINLSAADRWPFELQTLPRPSGRATRAIVTEYDMGRPTTEPHDVIVGADGTVWYSDFGELFIAKFDPKTLQLTEYPVKRFKPDAPVGNLSLDFDREGTLWFDTMFQGALGNLDPRTGAITYYAVPPQWNDDTVQLNFAGLRHDVDGKVWTKNVGNEDIYRIDLKTGQWQRFHPTDALPAANLPSGARRYSIYQVISDSKNNLWLAEFTAGHLGEIDAKTGKVTWFALPTPHARARRMAIDDADRITVTEYRGNKVAVFDPKTEQFAEYGLPPDTFPYRAQTDKNGDIWASTMSSDRITRLNPKTGETVQYLLPADTNMRSIFVDNSTSPVTVWVGSTHDHRLVKLEPLD